MPAAQRGDACAVTDSVSIDGEDFLFGGGRQRAPRCLHESLRW